MSGFYSYRPLTPPSQHLMLLLQVLVPSLPLGTAPRSLTWPPLICQVQKIFLLVYPNFRISVATIHGHSCHVDGEGDVQASSQLRLKKVLYVPDFPINLLSINVITKQLLCCVTFFPFHCTFYDLQMGRRIGLGRERGHGVYLLLRDDIPRGLASMASTSEPSILWH